MLITMLITIGYLLIGCFTVGLTKPSNNDGALVLVVICGWPIVWAIAIGDFISNL